MRDKRCKEKEDETTVDYCYWHRSQSVRARKGNPVRIKLVFLRNNSVTSFLLVCRPLIPWPLADMQQEPSHHLHFFSDISNGYLYLYTRLNGDGGNLLDYLSRRLEINQSLVDPHLKTVPGFGALTAWGLAGGNLEHLGWHPNWTLHLESLLLCSADQICADLLQIFHISWSKSKLLRPCPAKCSPFPPWQSKLRIIVPFWRLYNDPKQLARDDTWIAWRRAKSHVWWTSMS